MRQVRNATGSEDEPVGPNHRGVRQPEGAHDQAHLLLRDAEVCFDPVDDAGGGNADAVEVGEKGKHAQKRHHAIANARGTCFDGEGLAQNAGPG